MSLPLNQPFNQSAATADDLQEAMRAMLIVVSMLVDQIEESELVQRGHFAKLFGLIDERTLQKAAGVHPDGSARLALGLIRELQQSCSPTPLAPAAVPVKRWTPTLLRGGKE